MITKTEKTEDMYSGTAVIEAQHYHQLTATACKIFLWPMIQLLSARDETLAWIVISSLSGFQRWLSLLQI